MALMTSKKKTVDSVLSAFEKARNDLIVVASEHAAEACAKREAAAKILAEADFADAEAARAQRVAARAADLMS